jgi:hypothetical protein
MIFPEILFVIDENEAGEELRILSFRPHLDALPWIILSRQKVPALRCKIEFRA